MVESRRLFKLSGMFVLATSLAMTAGLLTETAADTSGCASGLAAIKPIAMEPDRLEYALVTLRTKGFRGLETEIETMRDMGIYVKFIFPPNAVIAGIPPRGHRVEARFQDAARERRWNVIRELVDDAALSEMTGVKREVFSLWNINYKDAGVLYGMKPAVRKPWGAKRHEKSLKAIRERRQRGVERSRAARDDGSTSNGGPLPVDVIALAASVGDLVVGPPCGSIVHGPTGIRYDPIEYGLGSWVISLVTPETPPDGVGGVTTNGEEKWNDNPADELLQVKSMVLTAANDMINGFTGDLTIGNMSVVFNFEDQVRTCCGQGKSDADCNFRCHEPIASESTIEQQYITDLTFPMGIDTTPIDFGELYPHLNYIFEYNDQQRNAFNTNWAHMIFAIDSTNDSDNLFPDGYYGWNYLATGYQTSVTGNYTYGFQTYSQLAQHETTHGPGPLDEYKFGGSSCSDSGGYQNVQNRNSVDGGGGCDRPQVDCVMKEAFPVVDTCTYTKGQAGGWDDDLDGIPNILDTIPTCTVSDAGGGNFTGAADVNPLPNLNPYSYVSPQGYTGYGLTNNNGLTLNIIVDVQYSVDGGPLQSATADDGSFDGCSEGFNFSASGSTIDVTITNSSGNTGTCQAGGQPGTCDGDDVCESGEDCNNCSSDCEGKTNGKPSTRFCCGNGVMEGPEGDGTICDGNF